MIPLDLRSPSFIRVGQMRKLSHDILVIVHTVQLHHNTKSHLTLIPVCDMEVIHTRVGGEPDHVH